MLFLYKIEKRDRAWLKNGPAGAYLKCQWDFKQAFLDELQEAIKACLILLSKK